MPYAGLIWPLRSPMEASSATDNDLTTLTRASAPALTLSLTAATAASVDPIATLKNWNDGGGFARAGPRQPLRSAAAPGTVDCTTREGPDVATKIGSLPLVGFLAALLPDCPQALEHDRCMPGAGRCLLANSRNSSQNPFGALL